MRYLGPDAGGIVHPLEVVEDVVKLLPDIAHHLRHGLLGLLLEVLAHVHAADGRREGSCGRA